MAEKRDRLSNEDISLINDGATVHALTLIFGMKHQDVQRKMGGCTPTGHTGRTGNPKYHLKDAAERLTKPQLTADELDRHIRKMNHASLPPFLTLAYWNARLARLKFEKEAGEYWHTNEVIEAVNRMLALVRMRLLMLPDNVEKKSPLTPRQLDFIRKTTDKTLEDIYDLLVQDFSQPPQSTDDGPGGLAGEGGDSEDPDEL